MLRRTIQQALPPLLLSLGWLAAAPASAQLAGEVEFSRGVGFAQTPGQAPRTLGKGLPLREGDRLTTSEGASAIIKLEDGTRMTVRPNSELVLQQYQFKENAPDNSMLMQLVRGGFRAVTGLISKNSPNAARIQTNTATIGIRGTDFDARLCTRDCGTESARVTESARPNAVLASAKIVTAQGEVNAVDANGQRRRLVDGGSIYPGDVVETGPGTRAVLAFRDDTRITLGSTTRFRVDNFVYDEANAGEGRFLTSILRGSVRVLTGLIAKANTRNVSFSTATATIGIRGSGIDMNCVGNCASPGASPLIPIPNIPAPTGEGLTVFVWQGGASVTPNPVPGLPPAPPAGTGPATPPGTTLLQQGQGLQIGNNGVQLPLTAPPVIDGPRPDQVDVPPKLFGKDNAVNDDQEGLFVFVRDGHIAVTTQNDVLHLGKGEAGFAGTNGQTARPPTIPKFIDFDKMPPPTTKNPGAATVVAESNQGSSKVCK